MGLGDGPIVQIIVEPGGRCGGDERDGKIIDNLNNKGSVRVRIFFIKI